MPRSGGGADGRGGAIEDGGAVALIRAGMSTARVRYQADWKGITAYRLNDMAGTF